MHRTAAISTFEFMFLLDGPISGSKYSRMVIYVYVYTNNMYAYVNVNIVYIRCSLNLCIYIYIYINRDFAPIGIERKTHERHISR